MRHPLLFQVNTRVALAELAGVAGRPATFDDFPDAVLERLRGSGFSWLWLLGVWQPSPAGQAVARTDPAVRRWLAADLPDLHDEDIVCSPFAIRGYSVNQELGGAEALSRLRRRAAAHGLRLLLDFVPNHVALDHPWVDEHPEYLVSGTREDLARAPSNYVVLASRGEPRIFAHGKDPHFDGWSDTLQLDYRRTELRKAMTAELGRIAQLCDGVRCDMAMLVLPDVFQRTWGAPSHVGEPAGGASGDFWPSAIAAVRAERPGFMFMAEAYWDLEWRLQQEGFDFTYDKRLYDRVRAGSARAVREHLLADAEYQRRCVRFLENHDEPRAAAVFPADTYAAAALVTLLTPGLRFFHEGQLDGRRRRVAMQLRRRAAEPPDPVVQRFYARLFECLARPELHDGQFVLHACQPAAQGDTSHEHLIAFSWSLAERRLLVALNMAPQPARGHVLLGAAGLASERVLFADLMSPARYERPADELSRHGLYLDLPAGGHHVFDWQMLR